MSLCAISLMMIDRPHPQVTFCSPEGIFYLSKLNVCIPYFFGILLCPVSAKKIAAADGKEPFIPVFVFFDAYLQAFLNTCSLFFYRDIKERCGPAVSLQKTPNPALCFLPIPESPLFSLLLNLVEPCFQSS